MLQNPERQRTPRSSRERAAEARSETLRSLSQHQLIVDASQSRPTISTRACQQGAGAGDLGYRTQIIRKADQPAAAMLGAGHHRCRRRPPCGDAGADGKARQIIGLGPLAVAAAQTLSMLVLPRLPKRAGAKAGRISVAL